MSEIKLKPCPFCGGEAYIDTFIERGDGYGKYASWYEVYTVCCVNELCHYRPQTERYASTIETAAEMWNKRANNVD